MALWALNGGESMVNSKTSQPLLAFWERVETLSEVEEIEEPILDRLQRAGTSIETEASNDDLLNAFALAITASLRPESPLTLPEEPETDEEDLPMEMVYAAPHGVEE